jgi:hypothetical protein
LNEKKRKIIRLNFNRLKIAIHTFLFQIIPKFIKFQNSWTLHQRHFFVFPFLNFPGIKIATLGVFFLEKKLQNQQKINSTMLNQKNSPKFEKLKNRHFKSLLHIWNDNLISFSETY